MCARADSVDCRQPNVTDSLIIFALLYVTDVAFTTNLSQYGSFKSLVRPSRSSFLAHTPSVCNKSICAARRKVTCFGTICPAPHPQRSGVIDHAPRNRMRLPRFVSRSIIKARSATHTVALLSSAGAVKTTFVPRAIHLYFLATFDLAAPSSKHCLMSRHQAAFKSLPSRCSGEAVSTSSPSERRRVVVFVLEGAA